MRRAESNVYLFDFEQRDTLTGPSCSEHEPTGQLEICRLAGVSIYFILENFLHSYSGF